MDVHTRRRLREALVAAYPWVIHPEVGPAAVDAGECDRCGLEPRMVLTCGPAAASLGRRCAAAVGVQAWCDGHEDDALDGLAFLAQLPDEADTVARLWWVATGEVRVDPALERAAAPHLAEGVSGRNNQ